MKKQPQVNVAIVIKSVQKQAAPLMKKLSTFNKITTKADFEKAGGLMKEVKNLASMATVEEKKITDPLQQAIKAAKAHFKPFQDSVNALQVRIKNEMTAYVAAQDKIAEKATVALETGKIKVQTYFKKVDEANDKKQSEFSQVRKIKVLKCINEKLTPREYLVPDEAKIKAAIINGEEVKGWEVVLENSIAI
jgi:hypothetical protein